MPSEWQPIETAPKDGTPVLLFAPDDVPQIVVGYAYKHSSRADVFWIYMDEALANISPGGADPTHWMPLPTPPEDQSNG